MTILEDVQNIIHKCSPQKICDDCIAEKLKMPNRQHANHKTRELATFSAYERFKNACNFCGGKKLVIKAKANGLQA